MEGMELGFGGCPEGLELGLGRSVEDDVVDPVDRPKPPKGQSIAYNKQ